MSTPYVAGSPTSYAAAVAKAATAATDEERVLVFIRASGEYGATDDELEVALGLLHQNASARRRTLVRKGLVKDSGRTRLTRSKRAAVVWIACDEDAVPDVLKAPTRKQWKALVCAMRVAYKAGMLDEDSIAAMKWIAQKKARMSPEDE